MLPAGVFYYLACMTEAELHSRLYPKAAAKREYITCAAIHIDNGFKYEHGPKNIETGFVICGHRHHDAIYVYSLLTNHPVKRKDMEGFLTSQNRFVSRKEAGQIAFEAGQIDEPTDCLFSEDIY